MLGSAAAFALGAVLTSYLYGLVPPTGTPASELYAKISQQGEPDITLRYFDIRGRAEPIRLYLTLLGLNYTEVVFTGEEWRGGLKSRWMAEGIIPFGQVPELSYDNVHLVQSHAILRFLARKHGGYNQLTEEAKARIEILAEGTEDLRKRLMTIKYDSTKTKEEKESAYLQFCTSTAQEWMLKFDGVISKSPVVSYADLLLYDLIDIHAALCPKEAFEELMKEKPNLQNLRSKVETADGIQEYLSVRRSY